jgi:pilus assembly protein CpaB
MRRKRILLVLVLAVLSGAIAGFAALRLLQERPVSLMASEAPRISVPFVVAVQDLEVGHMITEEDVMVLEWPSLDLPAGYLGSPPEAVGRGVVTPIRANEAILDTKLADPAGGGGLPVAIPEGMRAMSVAVDEVVGVAGFVLPGTRVDVLVTMAGGGNNREAMTRIILQNMQVVTAGQTMTRDANGDPVLVPVVTLLVTPEDAERLALASTQGRIQMALRNTLDLDDEETQGIRVSNLLSGRTGPARPAQRVTRVQPQSSREIVVETYRGGQRALVTFQRNN